MSPARASWSDCLLNANRLHPGMDPESRVRAYQHAINEYLERVENACPPNSPAAIALLDRTAQVQSRRWGKRLPLEIVK